MQLARGLDLDRRAGRRRRAGTRSGGPCSWCSRTAPARPGRRGRRRARPRRRCRAHIGYELLQPLEQRRLLGEPARGPLVEVVVAVDEARAWRGSRGRRSGVAVVGGAAPAPTAAIRPSVDDDVAVGVLGAGGVDRGDRAVLDDEPSSSRAPPAGRRRGSSRSPCSGTGCRPAPRGSPGRTGSASRASRSCVATISPGVQKPHWTAPACRNASWIGCSSSSHGASPSTVTISRPSAWPASTRQAHTSSPSR